QFHAMVRPNLDDTARKQPASAERRPEHDGGDRGEPRQQEGPGDQRRYRPCRARSDPAWLRTESRPSGIWHDHPDALLTPLVGIWAVERKIENDAHAECHSNQGERIPD